MSGQNYQLSDLIFTTSKLNNVQFISNLYAMYLYSLATNGQKNGFIIFSIEGVRASQFLAVLSDVLRFNLAMPTNRV